jgi:hypothetical protein
MGMVASIKGANISLIGAQEDEGCLLVGSFVQFKRWLRI